MWRASFAGPSDSSRSNLRPSFTGIALFAAIVLVLVLGWQNRGLREDRDRLTDRAAYAYLGMYVPIVDATTPEGGRVRLGAPSGERQVVYFFNHVCPYCRASAPQVAATAGAIRERLSDRAEIVGVCQCTPAQASAYARTHGFDFPVVAFNQRRELALYRARGVPVLMAIDREGRVRHTIQGVFDRPEQREALLASLTAADVPAPVATAH